VVHAPDLFEGRTFTTVEEGVAHAEDVGFETIVERGRREAERLPDGLVYIGFSLGVLPAQMLAQTRPGARGAVLAHSAIPLAEFGGGWPITVPLQIHMMDADPLALAEGDLDVARALAYSVDGAELFLYPGDRHLFADSSLEGYDETATELLTTRVLELLRRA
jgi:dienelactone hydrolase